MKAATCFEQTVNQYSNIATATINCKVSRLPEVFGRDEIGIITFQRLHLSKVPQTQSQSERHMVMFFCFFFFLNQHVIHDSPSSNSTFTGSKVQKTFDSPSDSSESLSNFKSFVAITLICSVCTTTGPLFALLFTILGLLLTSLLY